MSLYFHVLLGELVGLSGRRDGPMQNQSGWGFRVRSNWDECEPSQVNGWSRSTRLNFYMTFSNITIWFSWNLTIEHWKNCLQINGVGTTPSKQRKCSAEVEISPGLTRDFGDQEMMIKQWRNWLFDGANKESWSMDALLSP